MSALVMFAAICCAQLPEEKLLAELDAAVQKQLQGDPHAAEMRKAMRLLAETNNSDRWTDYKSATKILRKTRSKAGIPLLMAYMVRHVGLSSSHVVIPEYSRTLTILSGKAIPNPYQYVEDRKTPVRAAVEKWWVTWWQPQEAKITTDINEWSDEQIRVLAQKILEAEEAQLASYSPDPKQGQARPTAEKMSSLLRYRILGNSTDAPQWRAEELHPKMLPVLLAGAGYQADAKAAPERDTSRPAYAAVEILAALRNTGDLDQLDELAEDPAQAAGTRLTCIMALYRAGEKLRTPALLSILAKDKNLERRLAAILILRHCENEREVGATLVKLMDDENVEIRSAAIAALEGSLPPQAIAKLKQTIDEVHPPQAVRAALDVLGKYKHRDAREALAGFMAAGLEDDRKEKYVYYALSAFETSTGKRWGEAGAHPDEFYRAKAKEALEWWKGKGKLMVE